MARTTGKLGKFVLGFVMIVCGLLVWGDAEWSYGAWARVVVAAIFCVAGLSSMASASRP